MFQITYECFIQVCEGRKKIGEKEKENEIKKRIINLVIKIKRIPEMTLDFFFNVGKNLNTCSLSVTFSGMLGSV